MSRRLETLVPGQKFDAWVVLDLLGQGGMATVYRVRHVELGRIAALKVVAVPGRAIMERLRAEGRAQSRAQHRNIVAVLDVLDVEGSPGLLMDYVAGPPLDAVIAAVELDLAQIDGLGRGILRGMTAAHDAGLVHRDLKPANILVAVEGNELVPKVADFGLAKDFVAGDGATRTGAFMGTPNYMSPEQIRDPRDVDVRSDVFALGAILYELLARRRAFDDDDVLALFNRIAAGTYTPLAELRPDAPARMVAAVTAALQVDRAARPASCAELLALWSEGVPDSAVVASSESIDPAILERLRSLVSVPPSVSGGSDGPDNATVGWSQHEEALPAPVAAVPSPAVPSAAARAARPLAFAVLLAGLGLGVLGALVAGVVLLLYVAKPEREVARRAPIEIVPQYPIAPLPGPAPSAPPEPAPTAPVAPAPAVPVPTLPRPGVPVAPMPAPAVPEPVVEPVPPPEPAPPAVPTTGTVSVSGDVQAVELRGADGRSIQPGQVAPGTYAVFALFAGEAEPTAVLSGLVVAAGAEVRVKCMAHKCGVLR